MSGIVESIGPDVTLFQKGDRVFALSNGFASGKPDNGAFQSCTVVPVSSTAKLPNSIDFKHGVMFPMSLAAVGTALFSDLGLPRPTSEIVAKGSAGASILIWGGSSALGSMAIQITNLLGYTVYAVASPAHHAYLKSLGAEEVFDYHSPTVVADIIAAAQTPIVLAFDAVSNPVTLASIGKILVASGGQGGKLAHMLPWEESWVKPEGVELRAVASENLWSTQLELSTWLFHEFLPVSLEKGRLVASPKLRIVEGGLEGLQGAMDELKKGGVSGEKLVVELV